MTKPRTPAIARQAGLGALVFAICWVLPAHAQSSRTPLHGLFESCASGTAAPSDWTELPRSNALDAAFYHAGSIGFIVGSDFGLNPEGYDLNFEEQLTDRASATEAWLGPDLDAGLWTLLGHPAGWTAAVYDPGTEDAFIYCWAWHDTAQDDEIAALTGPSFGTEREYPPTTAPTLPWTEYTTSLSIETADIIREISIWGVVFDETVAEDLATSHARLFHQIRPLEEH